MGLTCSEMCPDGYFGENCTEECKCSNNVSCDHINGECAKECIPDNIEYICNKNCSCGTNKICNENGICEYLQNGGIGRKITEVHNDVQLGNTMIISLTIFIIIAIICFLIIYFYIKKRKDKNSGKFYVTKFDISLIYHYLQIPKRELKC